MGVPYSTGAAGPAPVTEPMPSGKAMQRRRSDKGGGDVSWLDVLNAQANWANTIKSISRIFLHHSSVPYSPHAASPCPISEAKKKDNSILNNVCSGAIIGDESVIGG